MNYCALINEQMVIGYRTNIKKETKKWKRCKGKESKVSWSIKVLRKLLSEGPPVHSQWWNFYSWYYSSSWISAGSMPRNWCYQGESCYESLERTSYWQSRVMPWINLRTVSQNDGTNANCGRFRVQQIDSAMDVSSLYYVILSLQSETVVK